MSIEKRIGYRFKNPDLLETALKHSSYSNESKIRRDDNERLSFWATRSFR
jgi:ribonuclease-3